MPEVVTGGCLCDKAVQICAEQATIYLAVAYWGEGAIEALGLQENENVHVVLNVEHGGTNPLVLQSLMALYPGRVRVHGTLHAKIFASKHSALIGSANASANGLFLMNAGHAEAAVYLQGESAQAAFNLAREFYNNGTQATHVDVATCRKRFGSRPLSTLTRSARPPAREVAFEFFLRNCDIFGPMPVILTEGAANTQVRDREWTEQQLVTPAMADMTVQHGSFMSGPLLSRIGVSRALRYTGEANCFRFTSHSQSIIGRTLAPLHDA